MNKPVLVVMAAGMGSRYGGMKQIDPVGPNGQVIMDYSLYDARRAGFETVIFVIKHEIEDALQGSHRRPRGQGDEGEVCASSSWKSCPQALPCRRDV